MMLYEEFLQSIGLSSVRFLLLIIFAAAFFVYVRNRKRRVNLPPGPPSLPLVGSIPWINRANPISSFGQWAEKHGPIVSFYIGSKLNVLINDAKLARDLLIKYPEIYSERADMVGARTKFGVKGSVILENGDDWKRHRRWVITGLRHFGMGKRSLEQQISTEATKLCDDIEHQANAFCPLNCIINAVSNIICSISFGKRYEYDDPEYKYLLENVYAYFKYSHFGRIEAALPFLMKFFKKRHQYAKNMISFLKRQMEEHKETFDENNIRDIIDMLLLQVKEEAETGKEEEEEYSANGLSDAGKTVHIANSTISDDTDSLWRAILFLFLAGTDTSTNTLMWYLLYMVCYPSVQERIYEEITNATQGEGPLKLQDKAKVPYFEATICEVQRLSNIAAALISHCTSADSVVNGYDVPANSIFNVNLTYVHRDPKYWKNPLEFRPERFLDEDEKSLKKSDFFMPFGLGRRACLGENLAKMEIYIFLSRLHLRFKFELPEFSQQPSFEPVVGITNSPQYYELIAKPR